MQIVSAMGTSVSAQMVDGNEIENEGWQLRSRIEWSSQ